MLATAHHGMEWPDGEATAPTAIIEPSVRSVDHMRDLAQVLAHVHGAEIENAEGDEPPPHPKQ
jgi:hypothetical protein